MLLHGPGSISKNITLTTMGVLVSGFLLLAQEGEQSSATLEVKVDLVNLDVVVKNGSGQRIRGLQKEDFEVYEDKVRQEIAHFENRDRGLKVILLFDTSLSMEAILPAVKREGIRLVESLRHEDRLIVASFDREVRLHSGWVDKEMVKGPISELKLGSVPWKNLPSNIPPGTLNDINTNLYEALDYVFRRFGSDKEVSVFVFSDGVDTADRATSKRRVMNGETVLWRAEESWAVIYPVCFKTQERKHPWWRPRVSMGHVFPWATCFHGPRVSMGHVDPGYGSDCELFSKIAASTGGEVFEFGNEQGLSAALGEALADPRAQYRLAYYPTRKDCQASFRHIQIRVRRRNAAVQARKGYRCKRVAETASQDE